MHETKTRQDTKQGKIIQPSNISTKRRSARHEGTCFHPSESRESTFQAYQRDRLMRDEGHVLWVVNSVTSNCISLIDVDWLEITNFSDVSDVSCAFNWLDINILILTSVTSWLFSLLSRFLLFVLLRVLCLVCFFIVSRLVYLHNMNECDVAALDKLLIH